MPHVMLKSRKSRHQPETLTQKRKNRPQDRQNRREQELLRMMFQCKAVDSYGTLRPARLH